MCLLCYKFSLFHSNPKQLQYTKCLVNASLHPGGLTCASFYPRSEAPYSCCGRRGVAWKAVGTGGSPACPAVNSPELVLVTVIRFASVSEHKALKLGCLGWIRWLRSSCPSGVLRLGLLSVLPHLGLCRVLTFCPPAAECGGRCVRGEEARMGVPFPPPPQMGLKAIAKSWRPFIFLKRKKAKIFK